MLREVSDAELGSGGEPVSEALERGEIIFFPRTPVPLPSAEALTLLRTELPARLVRKNVSLYAATGRLKGVDDPALAARVRAVLAERSAQVQGFLRRWMPSLTEGWTVGTSSFRPLQERGRNLSAHASNERIHVDAGAYGATHGDRILRFFTNVHPSEDRVWSTKGTFTELLRRYGDAAGVTGRSVRPLPWDHARSGVLRGLAGLGLPMARMLDGSPYDRVMRRFHNFMKDSAAFQADPVGHRELRFPPGTSWMVLTDTVSHACVSGQHAFVDTFLLRLSRCRIREAAPFCQLMAAAQRRSTAS